MPKQKPQTTKAKSFDTIRKEQIAYLMLELDYHLLSLSDALAHGDISVQEVEKRRLEEIRADLVHVGHFRVTAK